MTCHCLCSQRDLARSRQQVLKGEIVAFRRDLEGDMYKDADVKYRDKMIELKVCHLCLSVDSEISSARAEAHRTSNKLSGWVGGCMIMLFLFM